MNGSDICVDTNLISQLVVTERISHLRKKYDDTDHQIPTQARSANSIC